MFKKLWNYFWGQNENDSSEDQLTLEEAYDILKECIPPNKETCNEVQEEIVTGYDTYVKTGVITSKKGNEFMINDMYSFNSDSEDFCIGSRVSFTLILSSGILSVVDVVLIENDWNVVEEKKSTWCSRILICKVMRRDGRKLLLHPDEVTVDLNKINSEFVPIVGDWVELDAKCELDESITNLNGKILEINKIRPVRPQIKSGSVTIWDSEVQTGLVERSIHFSRESLSKGYIPLVGDKVICEIIESDQGNCPWRALKVFPEYLIKKAEDLTLVEADINFEEKHSYVEITRNVCLTFTKLKDSQHFSISVKNISDHDLVLAEVSIPRENRQCKLLIDAKDVVLEPEVSIQVLFECVSKNVGRTSELIIFDFSEFKVGRWVEIKVNVKNKYSGNVGRYVKNHRYIPKTTRDCIKGQGLNMPARFVNVKIPHYEIPDRFLKSVTQYGGVYGDARVIEELRVIKPALFKDLNYNNYEDRLHTLLYLDEIAALVQISIYDQPCACFIRNGEYLMLEIENLAEKKPSIIIGDRIMATDTHSKDSPTYEGVVHKVAAKHVYLKFRQDFQHAYNGEDYSVHVVSGRTTYRRMHYGIALAMKNLGRELLFPSQVIEKPAQVNFKINDPNENEKLPRGKMLTAREILQKMKVLNGRKSELLLSEDEKKDENGADENAEVEKKELTLEWYNSTFNFYQKEAVKNILFGVARPLPYIIFGPPGTGKTVTLVETILQILRLIPHARLLVAAPSNSASDLLALRLIDSGVIRPGDLVRLVSLNHICSNLIPPRLVPYCTFPNIASEGTHLKEIQVTNEGLALDCTSAVLGRHRITVTTCSSAGMLHQMGFPRGHFSHILVDEASQASEPEVMIPLSFFDRDSGNIILAGDPMQLGPTVLSTLAEELGLGESYQERLINRFPYLRDPEGFPTTGGYDPRLVTKLLYNYRSLPPLLNLSSNMFYNGELIPTISMTDSDEIKFLHKFMDILPRTSKGDVPTIVFHGVNGENFQTPDSPSWFNPDEVSQVFYYMNEFYRLGLSKEDIGIISPYVKQVKEIRSILTEAEFDIPKVGSVEEFQGQEFSVILLSTVRSDESYLEKDITYKLGFVSNPRRLNVAITRAKSLLIIIGNPNLLSKDVHWRTIIKYCLEHGGYTGCDIVT